jgi:UDP-glucose 4-epimerase
LCKQLLWDICSRLQAGERNLMLGGTGAEVRDWTDVRDVVRLLAAIDGSRQTDTFQLINAGSGLGTTVAQVATLLAECWGGTVSLQYSGIVRAGDPPSLLADDAMLRTLPFDWKIPVEQGFADYVSWFKDQVR